MFGFGKKSPPPALLKAATITSSAARWPTATAAPAGDEWPRPFDFSTAIEAIKLNPYHAGCVRIKAMAAVGLGWRLVDAPTGEPRPDAYDAWTAAWPAGGFSTAIWTLALDLETFGNAYVEAIPLAGGAVALYPIPAVTVWRTQHGYRQRTGARQQDWPAWDGTARGVYALGLPHPEASAYGVPDWLPALNAILMDAHASEWNYRFFQNNCMPAWAIVAQNAALNAEAEAAIRDFFQAQHKGSLNAHKTLLLSTGNGELRFERLQTDAKDMSFAELKRFARDEVLAAHGVPPRLLGVIAAGQLGGGGEMTAQLQFFKDCLIAQRQALLADWLRPLLPEGLALKFTEMDITDPQTDATYLQTLVQSGVLQPNEARAELGMGPVEGLDEAALGRGL
ncbi:MAG: phage portal protein [Candidatus Contendobacter sp.]|nr:MAG: phage portal protein [Candidatus Contendobacter sp.]